MDPDEGEAEPRLSRRSLLAGAGACVLCALGGVASGALRPAGATTVPARGATLAAAHVLTDTTASRHATQPDALFRVPTDERVVALTFDDGPDPRFTPTVLELLRRHRARATFFVIGVNALGHRDLVADEIAGGHAVANHTYDHAVLDGLGRGEVAAEIAGGTRALLDAGAGRPAFFRPPKGFTSEIVGRVAGEQRLRTVFWTSCVERYVDHQDVDAGVSQLLERVVPGSIILAHDGGRVLAPGHPVLDRSRTMAALPRLLDGLHRQGYKVVDVATLLAMAGEPHGARL